MSVTDELPENADGGVISDVPPKDAARGSVHGVATGRLREAAL